MTYTKEHITEGLYIKDSGGTVAKIQTIHPTGEVDLLVVHNYPDSNSDRTKILNNYFWIDTIVNRLNDDPYGWTIINRLEGLFTLGE